MISTKKWKKAVNNWNDKKFRLKQYLDIKVKQARVESGLKIADLARLSEISQGMVSKIKFVRKYNHGNFFSKFLNQQQLSLD